MRILSFGAGVQTTALAILAARGDVEPFDVLVFADTGGSPCSIRCLRRNRVAGRGIVSSEGGTMSDCEKCRSLEAQIAEMQAEISGWERKWPYIESSGHYCDGMSAAWQDAQRLVAVLPRPYDLRDIAGALARIKNYEHLVHMLNQWADRIEEVLRDG